MTCWRQCATLFVLQNSKELAQLLRLTFSYIFFLTTTCGFGQIVEGKIMDHSTKNPIAYVNIGILNSPIGTISNEDGTFSVRIPPTYTGDSLIFSMLGYERRAIQVRLLIDQRDFTIYLQEKPTTLETVTIDGRQKKPKGYPLGNRYSKGGLIYCDSVAAGSAIALLIENKYPSYHEDLVFPVFAAEARLFINRNTMDSFKVRIRFLSKDEKTGLPGPDFFNQSIVVTSDIRHGWISFDLVPYQILIRDSSFFLAFEWIMDERDRLNLLNQYYEYRTQNPDMVTGDTVIVAGSKVGYRSYHQFQAGTSFGVSQIPFSMQNYTCYYRLNSFGEWMRAPAILTARLVVK